jgi:predicted component of type VI protein secretion system
LGRPAALAADHSTNGTWVDGERMHRGSRVALANGAVLGFGRDRGNARARPLSGGAGPAHAQAGSAGASAHAGHASCSTPVAPGSRVRRSGACAAKCAARGARHRRCDRQPENDVLKLPFTIGRGSAQNYVVPDANQGVSREHLVIESIDRAGAVTLNRAVARNGTFAGNQALPERFCLALWPGNRARREMDQRAGWCECSLQHVEGSR